MALSAYDQRLAWREEHIRLCAAGGEDRLSALLDDVLHLILRRLDTRSALATAALSRHWARLPRELPVLEFKVSDVLPERYSRYLRRRLDAAGHGQGQREVLIRKLDVLIGRQERQGMRSLGKSITSFLKADDGGNGEGRRSAQAITLELFPTHNSAPFDQLITKAAGDWGVRDLEVTVLKPNPCHDASYSFPHHCFEHSKSPASLKRLKLSNCAPLAASPPHHPRPFGSLTVLVLQGMTRSTSLYQRVNHACPMLEALHLKSCSSPGNIPIGAPGSRITELIVDACAFGMMTLHALPRLERLAFAGAPVQIVLGALPRLSASSFAASAATIRTSSMARSSRVRTTSGSSETSARRWRICGDCSSRTCLARGISRGRAASSRRRLVLRRCMSTSSGMARRERRWIRGLSSRHRASSTVR